MNADKLCWIDLRGAGALAKAVRAEVVQQRIDGVVSDQPEDFEGLPSGVAKVLWLAGGSASHASGVDIIIAEPGVEESAARLAEEHPGVQVGRLVDVTDAGSLELACRAAAALPWTVLRFAEPTRIPLEIVLAAAANATGHTICQVADPAEAQIVLAVLEHGPHGVMLAPSTVGDVTRLKAAARPRTPDLPLAELRVTAVTHAGVGERACVDTCTHLRPDEGILVGSASKGMVLCVSETHPLPYMPTRPFRVNAGAIMSYTMATEQRTRYLSELRAGSHVLAVDAAGHTRQVTVGRIKVETRPLLSIDAVGPAGQAVNLIVQDDWHVRVLGPGAAVLNSTELRPGDRVLGYLPTQDRHVGYPIDEFCLEQ